MKKKLDWIAIVPARKGSKRLPNKNLLKLGDLSLVEIAVKKALQSSVFDRVLISSDSQEIIDKTQILGAEALGGLRKKELSGDNATTIDVIKDLDKVYVALDKDATSKAYMMVRKLRNYVPTKLIVLNKDLKDMEKGERNDFIRRYIN